VLVKRFLEIFYIIFGTRSEMLGAFIMRKYKTYTPAELTVWIRDLIARNDIHAFYICHAWLHVRAEVLREQHCEC